MNFPKPATGMLPNDRLAYSAIPTRKPLKLPKDARMAVWTVTNVEEWDPTQTMPRPTSRTIDKWERPYSRAEGCFPMASLRQDKYWCPVNRVDNVYGDRHLICSRQTTYVSEAAE